MLLCFFLSWHETHSHRYVLCIRFSWHVTIKREFRQRGCITCCNVSLSATQDFFQFIKFICLAPFKCDESLGLVLQNNSKLSGMVNAITHWLSLVKFPPILNLTKWTQNCKILSSTAVQNGGGWDDMTTRNTILCRVQVPPNDTIERGKQNHNPALHWN